MSIPLTGKALAALHGGLHLNPFVLAAILAGLVAIGLLIGAILVVRTLRRLD